MAVPGVGRSGLDQIRAPMGDALEDGAHDLRALGATRETEESAASAVIPGRCAEPEQRRHVDHAARIVALSGDVVALCRGVDEASDHRATHSTLVPADSRMPSTPHPNSPLPIDQTGRG